MDKLVVLCGVPGSGKTTLSKQLADQYEAVVHSFDDLKLQKRRDFIPYIRRSLEAGQSVVADAPHTDRKTRLELLQSIRHINCKKILVFVDTPFDECVRRNAQRVCPLPFFVIQAFYSSLERPELDEGWDEILYY